MTKIQSLVSKIATIAMFASTFLIAPPPALAAVGPGALVKIASSPAVYYVATDGKRYVFFNSSVYFSWYPDFRTVQTISNSEMASLRIGGNVTYRPGVKMLKIQSDPKVYAVARGGTLRWVTTEAVAAGLYGSNWNQYVDDVDVSEFINYRIGTSINATADFSKAVETLNATSINSDKGLGEISTPTPTPNPTPSPTSQTTFSLSSQTPTPTVVARGATNIPVLTFNVRHDGPTTTTINTVTVRRFGTGANSDISRLYLYSGGNVIGTSTTFDSANITSFVGLNMNISPGQSHTLSLSADFSNNATPAKTNAFEVVSILAGNQLASSSSIQGNYFTTASSPIVTQPTLTVIKDVNPITVARGVTNQLLASFSLNTSNTESVRVSKVALQVASENTTLSNLSLVRNNVAIASVTAPDSTGKVTFNLGANSFDIVANSSANLSVRANVAATVPQTRFTVYMPQDSDLTAVGVTTGSATLINRTGYDNSSNNGADATWVTITGSNPAPTSTLSVSMGTNIPARTVLRGQVGVSIMMINITNSGASAMVVDQVIVRRIGGSDSDINRLSLYEGDTRISDSLALSNGQITFGNINPFGITVAVGATRTLTLVANISPGSPNIVSQFQVTAVQSGATLANGLPITSNNLTIITSQVNVITASAIVAAYTPTRGGINQTFASFMLNAATSENLRLKRVTLKVNTAIPPLALFNWNLYNNNIIIASTSTIDASGRITFVLPDNALFNITAGTSQGFTVKADLTNGSSVSGPVTIFIQEDVDLLAIGADTNAAARVVRTLYDNSPGGASTNYSYAEVTP